MSKQQKTSVLIILLSFAGGVWLAVMPHLLEAGISRYGPGAVDRFKEIEVGFRVFTYFCYFVGFQGVLLGIGMLWHRRRKSLVSRPVDLPNATSEPS